MDWRAAKSLLALRDEVNAKWPLRSKDSDGIIGDAAHASRDSDHNPWITDAPGPNVVSGMDITHDPVHGFDSYAFAEWLKARRDRRIKYIISNRRICSSTVSPWTWRSYSGANPHDHHVHISVDSDKPDYDNVSSWGVGEIAELPPSGQLQPKPVPVTLRQGSKGDAVRTLQSALAQHNIPALVDGDFGPATKAAVVQFQTNSGLGSDGVVGPQTWKALLNL